MKVVILAGGFGSRISEESILKPKPMIEIAGMPILWHIMKIYEKYDYNDFIICAGYKQQVIKEWFANYYLYSNDVTFDYKDSAIPQFYNTSKEEWKVTIVDTGLDTMTGGRIKRIQNLIGDEPFLMTYGDGLSDINILDLVTFHRQEGKLATLTAVQPEGRFGVLDIEGKSVISFREKSHKDSAWINGGYMVLEPQIFDYISGDSTIFEREPLEKLAEDNQIACYKHYGFWKCMDTMKDKMELEQVWRTNK